MSKDNTEGRDGKARRATPGQSIQYRDKVLQVVKAQLAAAPVDEHNTAPRLSENMEERGEVPSIISQALWRLGPLQGMLLLTELRTQRLLEERPEQYSWSTEERFVKTHNVVMSFLFANCHSPQCDATTMIAVPAHLLKVERLNDLIHSGIQVAKARGKLELFLEQLDGITDRGTPPLRPPPLEIGDTNQAASSGSGDSLPTEMDRQNSAVIGEERASQDHSESMDDPQPSGLWRDEHQDSPEHGSQPE